jgi:hypothetical protein
MSTKKMFGKSMELEYDERLQQSHCSKTVGTLQTKALQLQQSFVSHHNEHRKDGCCIFQQGRNKQPEFQKQLWLSSLDTPVAGAKVIS